MGPIEDVHFYDISFKMELRHMENQTKILIIGFDTEQRNSFFIKFGVFYN